MNGPPNCAKGQTFCENFDPYPSDHIQDILEKKSGFEEFWGKDEASEFALRDEMEDQFVCSTYGTTIFPNIGKNKDNKWKFIINQPDGNYRQGIRIETCRS